MIRLDALVNAVQAAVTSANDELHQHSRRIFSQFFDNVEPPSGDSAAADKDTPPAAMRPRYVAVEFPTETRDGIKTITVDVPLIAIVPMASSRIEEVTFRSTLNISENPDGELNIAFAKTKAGHGLFGRDKEPATHSAELEIKIRGDDTPDGLRQLIEGYERALRAQIPG
ncbi:MAG: hypothetical protein CMI02_19080 [Oceanospirillaceae bacterium]|nr:hypothetical protein [Oceanospirillaceae bacterium]MBT14132.1 hypothetical protein [Oceanospirillaceae bacterium]|tara:strand:- start:38112 stop:38621 length:510 start_codon:yes stop_codon:yes gene_type:complete